MKKEQNKIYKSEEMTCRYCNVLFVEKEELKEHAKRYSDKDRNYICSESGCGQKYTRGRGQGNWSNALQIHMMKHRGEHKPLSCFTCGSKQGEKGQRQKVTFL